MSMINQFIDSMDEEKEYDFIANNYNSMSKFELRSILLEYIYAIHSTPHSSMNFSADVTDKVRENLEADEVFG